MVTKEKDASNYTFLKYKNLEDMLKVILFSAQSPLGLVPLLYHIEAKKNRSYSFKLVLSEV